MNKYGLKVSFGTDIYPAEVLPVEDRTLVHARRDSEDGNGRQRRAAEVAETSIGKAAGTQKARRKAWVKVPSVKSHGNKNPFDCFNFLTHSTALISFTNHFPLPGDRSSKFVPCEVSNAQGRCLLRARPRTSAIGAPQNCLSTLCASVC